MNKKTLQNLYLLNLIYLLGVILLGAYVRAAGAGAGCGNHWPLCNGEALPSFTKFKTVIEYSHRITSGLTIPFAIFLLFWVFRLYPRKSTMRRMSCSYLVLLGVEAFIGAALVKLEHVANNSSELRILSISAHLLNTFCLMWVATWLVYHHRFKKFSKGFKTKVHLIEVFWGIGLFLLVGISGAITALGDTIFPVSSMGEAIYRSLSAGENLIVRLRIYHPLIAVFSMCFLLLQAVRVSLLHPPLKATSGYLICGVLGQIFLGYLNVYLHAPIWLQIIHLLVAHTIWILYIYLIGHVIYMKRNLSSDH